MKHSICVIYPGEFRMYYNSEETNSDVNAILETVFDGWNDGSGREHEEFKKASIRSMGSGDIVEVDGVSYLCMPAGWKEITHEASVMYINEVKAHPSFRTEGAWFAMKDVMWKKYRKVG
jgi:hypothetical protein